MNGSLQLVRGVGVAGGGDAASVSSGCLKFKVSPSPTHPDSLLDSPHQLPFTHLEDL